MIIRKKTINNTLFVDIETVSEYASFTDLSEEMKDLWKSKCRILDRSLAGKVSDQDAANLYLSKAGIFAEFAKVVSISVGYLKQVKKQKRDFRTKSFFGEDERSILVSFSELVNKFYGKPDKFKLCGHNIKEFDIPFLCRRMVLHGLKLPRMLSIAGKKPWQVSHLLDTMELWKFGDYKHFVSLKLLTAIFNIPSPKDDIDGSQVGAVYWEEQNLKRIAAYCEKDVIAVAQVAMKFAGEALLEEDEITSVTNW